MSEGMQIAALYHIKMAEELAVLLAEVPSTTEFTLRHSPSDTFRMEVKDELIAEILKQEEWWSRIERSSTRFYDLILGPPFGRARLADRLEEDAGQHGAEQAAR
jgi:hypothetical protein